MISKAYFPEKRNSRFSMNTAGSLPQSLRSGQSFANGATARHELRDLERAEQEHLRLLDLWKFQRNEIESAQLLDEEDASLEAERRVLQNVGRLSEGATVTYSALYDDEASAYALVRIALKRLEDLRRFDEDLGRVADLVKPAEIAIDEAAGELRDYLGRLEADPSRLEEVEARLAAIDKLKRKYGGSVTQILQFLSEVTANLDVAENASEQRSSIEKRAESTQRAIRIARAGSVRSTTPRCKGTRQARREGGPITRHGTRRV